MSVTSIPSTSTGNIALQFNIRAAGYAGANFVSATDTNILRLRNDFFNPELPASPPSNYTFSGVAGQSYRYLRLQTGGNGYASITSPTSPTNYRTGEVATNSTTSTADDFLYLRAISYSTYSSITVEATPDYGYSFSNWEDALGTTIIASNPQSMTVSEYTSAVNSTWKAIFS